MSRERLLSLDLFRGATVAGMLLVNNPGTWASIYPPLRHAPWHGWTPTDLIFPFFLFIVGITTEWSLSARRDQGASETDMLRQILRRGVLVPADRDDKHPLNPSPCGADAASGREAAGHGPQRIG